MRHILRRFNRYIVECKLNNSMLTGFNGIRFNRYIVECKYKLDCSIQTVQTRFNRYIVECKLGFYGLNLITTFDLIDT